MCVHECAHVCVRQLLPHFITSPPVPGIPKLASEGIKEEWLSYSHAPAWASLHIPAQMAACTALHSPHQGCTPPTQSFCPLSPPRPLTPLQLHHRWRFSSLILACTLAHTHTDLDTCWQLPIPAGKMNGISLAWAVNDWVGLGRRRYSNGGKLRTRWERHGGVGQQATETNLDNFSPMITSVMCSCLSKEASIHFTTSGITG